MVEPAEGARRPLGGLLVVEAATFIFGPGAATVMADYGAEVVKIECPPLGDPYRFLFRVPPMPECEENYNWVLDFRNKESAAINLKHASGHEVLCKLIERADVFVANQHPSVLQQLKLTYDELSAINPRLIYAHVTGYPIDGPLVEQPGYDMTAYWARSGLMDSVAPADGDPALSVAGMGDHPSSMALFGGIMLALFHRERTGLGTRVTTSLLANGIWANGCNTQAALCGSKPYVKGSRGRAFNVLVNHYLCRDGKRLLLCCLQAERHWPLVCKVLELEHLTHDPRYSTGEARRENSAELVALLDASFARHDYAYWAEALTRQDLVFSPVHRTSELVSEGVLEANGLLTDMDHPDLGTRRTLKNPLRLDGLPQRRPGPSPRVGQHTRAVLERLGYTSDQIAELAASGAIQVEGA